MKIWCDLIKSGKFYEVKCETLLAFTQGKTKKEAYEMMGNWVRTMLDDPDFPFEVSPRKEGFFISFRDVKAVFGLMLSQLQVHSEKSVDVVVKEAGYKSRNAYHQYKNGKHEMGLSTLQRLADVYGFDISIGLVSKKSEVA